jgi:hypothetical protein
MEPNSTCNYTFFLEATIRVIYLAFIFIASLTFVKIRVNLDFYFPRLSYNCKVVLRGLLRAGFTMGLTGNFLYFKLHSAENSYSNC